MKNTINPLRILRRYFSSIDLYYGPGLGIEASPRSCILGSYLAFIDRDINAVYCFDAAVADEYSLHHFGYQFESVSFKVSTCDEFDSLKRDVDAEDFDWRVVSVVDR